jgi:hypothetical protein
MRDNLEIQIKGDLIDGELYATVIQLSNGGKIPIRSSDFDQSQPLQFKIDKRIIKLLSTEHVPPSAPSPEFTTADRIFSLKPALIMQGEVIKVTLLTAGRPTQVQALSKPFGDVDVEIGDNKQLHAKRNLRSIARIVPIISAVAAFASLIVLMLISLPDNSISNLTVTIAGDCDKSAGDSNTALFMLQTLRSQTSTLEAETSNPSTSITFYEQTLTLARNELITLNKDYRAFTPSKSVNSMITSTGEATSIIEKALNPISEQTIVNLSDELPAAEKELSLPSTIRSLCKGESVQVNSESFDVSGSVQVVSS